MPKTKVVNIHAEGDNNYHVYIGRRRGVLFHFGNPFTYEGAGETDAEVVLPTREDCIEAYEDWLLGKDYLEFWQERRQWILGNLYRLKGKKLGCWCSPSPCHGDVLARLADKI